MQDTYILEALRAQHSGVALMLHKDWKVLGNCLLCGFVPVIFVCVGHDDGVHAFHDLLDRHRKIH